MALGSDEEVILYPSSLPQKEVGPHNPGKHVCSQRVWQGAARSPTACNLRSVDRQNRVPPSTDGKSCGKDGGGSNSYRGV